MSVFRRLIAEGDLTILAQDGRREAGRYRGGTIAHPEFARCALDIYSPTFGCRTFESGDLFRALIEFRKVVEPQGWLVLCNGARRDVWPSGMLADWSTGTSVYLLSGPKEKTGSLPLLDTFGLASPSDVARIEEQIRWRDEFFANWRPKE